MEQKLNWNAITPYLEQVGERWNIFTKRDIDEAQQQQITDWLAANCPDFCPDEEEEQDAADAVNCFNCRYRRWLPQGFCCRKCFPIKQK